MKKVAIRNRQKNTGSSLSLHVTAETNSDERRARCFLHFPDQSHSHMRPVSVEDRQLEQHPPIVDQHQSPRPFPPASVTKKKKIYIYVSIYIKKTRNPLFQSPHTKENLDRVAETLAVATECKFVKVPEGYTQVLPVEA